MKSLPSFSSSFSLLPVFLLAALTVAPLPLRAANGSGNPPSAVGGSPADSGQDGPGGPWGGDCRPNDLRLIATASAPAGAVGQVRIDLSDPSAPALALQVNGLAAGTYTVEVTTTDATATAVGTFDVLAATAEGSPTKATVALPEGFDPKTLATVQIADASGTVLLSATQHDPMEGEHLPDFHLRATAAAPTGAGGLAQIDVSTPSTPGLKVDLRGLTAGTYTMEVVSLSSGTVTNLGTVDVAAATTGVSDGTADLSLPAVVLPTDLASVEVLDGGGVLMLTGDGACRGGAVAGSEALHQDIVLTATADASAGLDGRAELDAHDRQGTSEAMLAVAVRGLAAGTYTVSVTSQGSDTVTALGTITATGNGKDRFEIGTEDSAAFPAGFNPLDIATVEVSDATGVVLLTGDFSSPATPQATTYVATVKTTAGSAAPSSSGSATAAARVTGTRVTQSFALTAKGVPASTTLTLTINGVAAGQVQTTRQGNVSIGHLPRGTEAQKITSVTLETASGATVLGAYF